MTNLFLSLTHSSKKGHGAFQMTGSIRPFSFLPAIKFRKTLHGFGILFFWLWFGLDFSTFGRTYELPSSNEPSDLPKLKEGKKVFYSGPKAQD